MKRDDFDFNGNSASAESLPASEVLIQLAHSIWLDSLIRNGNQLSADHEHVGRQLLRAAVDQLYGMYTGRYAYALACGAGKTQAVVALLSAMVELKVFPSKTVLVVAQEVEALCGIKQQLLERGVPELAIGILHSKPNAKFQSTGNQKRPIMLATHARIQWDGSLQECCLNRRGELHDLVIWDEALISTRAITLDLVTTQSALRHFAEYSDCPTVATANDRLTVALSEERASQQAGKAAAELSPLVTEPEAEKMLLELQAVGYLDGLALQLRERALKCVSLLQHNFCLIDARNGQRSEGLMRYVIKVPDGLQNVVILDASHAIDELRQADRSIRNGTTEAMTSFKRYDSVTATHYLIASGRSRAKQDRKAFEQAASVVKTLPSNEPVLLVTYKDWHEKELAQCLRAAGVPLDRRTPEDKPWLRIISWGRHTSDNSHTHCKHVVLVGLLRLPLLETASQLAAQRRDLTHRRNKLGLLDLERSVVAGNVLQAANRGCMRLTDATGTAHSMTVHIIDHDAALRPLLQKVMPGLQWESVSVKEPTRTDDAAKLIVDFLMKFPRSEPTISTRRLYAECGMPPGKDLRAAALSEALVLLALRGIRDPDCRWKQVGRSLVRCSAV